MWRFRLTDKEDETDLMRYKELHAKGRYDELPAHVLVNLSSKILTSTTDSIPGHEIDGSESFGVIAVSDVPGMSFIKDWFIAIRDNLGGKSKTYSKTIEQSIEVMQLQLRIKAMKLGANAIIGLHINSNPVSGGGKSMHEITVYGTAVVVKRSVPVTSEK